jgi:hypothetical protein
MELIRTWRDPAAVARGVRSGVGRVVQRLRDRTRLALPAENGFLRDLGGRFGTIEEALAAAGLEGRLFLTDLPRSETAAFFARHPQRRARILGEADRACAHRFEILGSGPRDLGPRLPWHADFVSGRSWDKGAHFRDLQSRIEREFGNGSDVKIPRELSRFQHLPALGQAFWLTGDRRYYQEFRAEVLDWTGENRPGFGVNWACTMDVAIRSVNWVWGYGFFRPETLEDRAFGSLLLRSLFAHGRFIASTIDSNGANTSRYFAGLVGLLFLGVLFRGSPEADAWKGMAVSGIVRESQEQIDADGVHHEASTSCHRLMTEMAMTALLLLERCGFRLPELRSRVRSMAEYIAHYTKPGGLAPQIGDNDDGRLQILGEYDADRRDHRHLLGVAGCVFADPALLALAGPRWEEAWWLCGPAAGRLIETTREAGRVVVTGRHFPIAGAAILRQGDLYAFVEAGPAGRRGPGSHAHNDSLSVEIQAAGQDLLVDPGTGTYTRDLALRQRFRGTAAHNTLRVDGEEINPLPESRFESPGADQPAVLRFVSRSGFDLVEAEHRGYARLADPVLHRRVVLLNKRTRRFLIEDHLEGRGRHRVEAFFHLAPRCEAFIDEDGLGAVCRAGEVRFRIQPLAMPPGTYVRREQDLFSPGYGRVEPSLTLRYEWTGTLPIVLRFAVDVEGEASRIEATGAGTAP